MSSVRFRISVPAASHHLFHIEVTVHGVGELASLDFHLPAWSPGSYFIREYAQHLERFIARGDDGGKRMVRKNAKATWTVDCRDTNSVELSYDVYSHDLGVRNNHVDATHGFLTPSATFVHPEGRLADEIEVEIVAPDDWGIFCPLPNREGSSTVFYASDFDELYDAPIEIGPHKSFTFDALGVEHTVVFWGEGNYDQERLARDMPKIVEANAELFGGTLPYDSYLTIVLLTDGHFGGLEHRNSTALMFDRHGFSKGEGTLDPPITDKGYVDFLTLFAHEHFHTWHVKRIRPQRLGPFDYSQENYTRDIWTIEGITSYYQDVMMLRAGLIDPQAFLDGFADAIRVMETIPGRQLQSLEDSSFDAWIKLYRPHENNRNSTVSYYLKGSVIAGLLDIYLRSETGGERTLDTVMQALWKSYSGEAGSPEGGLEAIVEDVAGIEVWEFFDALVRGTRDPDYQDYFESVGLVFERTHKDAPKPWIGADLKSKNGELTVTSLRSDGPAYTALDVNDVVLSVNHYRVDETSVAARLRDAGIGNTVQIHVFREGLLMDVAVPIEASPPDIYVLSVRPNLVEEVAAILEGWLGPHELKPKGEAKP